MLAMLNLLSCLLSLAAMPLNFQPASHSAIDPVRDISIPRPRILPTTLRDGTPGTEYQYAIYRGDQRIGGLGFEGSDEIVQKPGCQEWVFTFDLCREQTIRSMLTLKAELDAGAGDFQFLQDIAQGLVMAYAGRTDNEEGLRYRAVTSVEALQTTAVAVPEDLSAFAEQRAVVLAEAVVPGHGR